MDNESTSFDLDVTTNETNRKSISLSKFEKKTFPFLFLEDPCAYMEPVYVKERFWMVAIFGTAVCILNIIENTFLSFMLFKK